MKFETPQINFLGEVSLPLPFQLSLLNPLNPKSDQHQSSPCNINAF